MKKISDTKLSLGIFITALALLLLWFLVFIFPSLPWGKSGDLAHFPVYPNASDYSVSGDTGEEPMGDQHTITFTTVDPSEAVIIYYQTTLIRQGWIDAGIDEETGGKEFRFLNCHTTGFVHIRIAVSKLEDQETLVKITFNHEYCR